MTTIRRPDKSAPQPVYGPDQLPSSEQGPAFARHETFAPRAGWLKKGVDAASINHEIFVQDDAPAVLGVGKNMARAIRYWTHAFDLLEDVAIPGSRLSASQPTELGQFLMGAEGYDPYLESAGSLWYLHWRLVRTPRLATSWHYVFSIFSEIEFTQEHLDISLRAYVRQQFPAVRAADTSLHKDILCLLRMYGDAPEAGTLTEDSVRCPFAELGLLRPTGEPKTFAFDLGEKPDLPAEVVVAACLEYAATQSGTARTIGFGRLLYDPGSPGMAFKLTESALAAAIEQVSGRHRSVTLADTAGLVQLAFKDEPLPLARRLLVRHLREAGIAEVAA